MNSSSNPQGRVEQSRIQDPLWIFRLVSPQHHGEMRQQEQEKSLTGIIMQGPPEGAVGYDQFDGGGRIEGSVDIVLQGHDNPREDREEEADQRTATPVVFEQPLQRGRPCFSCQANESSEMDHIGDHPALISLF